MFKEIVKHSLKISNALESSIFFASWQKRNPYRKWVTRKSCASPEKPSNIRFFCFLNNSAESLTARMKTMDLLLNRQDMESRMGRKKTRDGCGPNRFPNDFFGWKLYARVYLHINPFQMKIFRKGTMFFILDLIFILVIYFLFSSSVSDLFISFIVLYLNNLFLSL